MYDNEIG
ncbi:Protein of unknown function [Bacillus mycoides]|nr:Protein of unknown function [Bacillus mycoides]